MRSRPRSIPPKQTPKHTSEAYPLDKPSSGDTVFPDEPIYIIYNIYIWQHRTCSYRFWNVLDDFGCRSLWFCRGSRSGRRRCQLAGRSSACVRDVTAWGNSTTGGATGADKITRTDENVPISSTLQNGTRMDLHFAASLGSFCTWQRHFSSQDARDERDERDVEKSPGVAQEAGLRSLHKPS